MVCFKDALEFYSQYLTLLGELDRKLGVSLRGVAELAGVGVETAEAANHSGK